MAENRTAYASVKVEGANIAATVQSITLEDDDRAIDKATIIVDDPHEAAAEVAREQQRVLVDLGWVDEHAVLFEGVVTAVETSARGGGSQRVTIQAYDLSYRLMQGTPPPPVNHVGKLSDILRTVFNRVPSGVEVGEIAPDPDPEFTEESPLRQANERDWQFIQRMAVRHNCRAFVEYNDGASRFYFLPVRRLLQSEPLGTLKYCRGLSQLIEFNYQRIASAAAPSRSAEVEDPLTGELRSAAGTPPQPAEPPSPSATTRTRLEGLGPGRAQDYESAMELAASAPGNPSEQLPQSVATGLPSDPALAQAAIQQDPTRVLGYLGRGEAVGTVMLRAKGRVTIEGLAPWAAGDWYVRQVRHVYTRAVSGEQDRSTYRTHLVVTR